jgi:hypothetical protein
MSKGAAIRASMATAPRFRCSHIVDLDVDGARTLFEFDPSGDRAFSVGASSSCDLRVQRESTPRVAFYLERRTDGIWLVPAYRRGGLRVNGVAGYVSTGAQRKRSQNPKSPGVGEAQDTGDGVRSRSPARPACAASRGARADACAHRCLSVPRHVRCAALRSGTRPPSAHPR